MHDYIQIHTPASLGLLLFNMFNEFNLKVCGRVQGGPSMEHQNQPSSSVKIAELDGCSGGTGVFHPPYIIRRHGPKNNNKRRNKRGALSRLYIYLSVPILSHPSIIE